jgi:MFS family permease
MLFVAASWQMYELTGSAWDLGLVGLFQFAPVLLLTLPAGHVADRFHRARVLALSVALQAAAAAILLGATAASHLSPGLLFGISALLGVSRTFQLPAQQSLVASIVPLDLLARATAFSSAGGQVATIGGPALAGLLFAISAESVLTFRGSADAFARNFRAAFRGA